MNTPYFRGYVHPKSHTRHPHTSSAHRRSIRADIRTNLSHDDVEYSDVYSKQGDQLVLECAVNINFSTSIWLKDGQIVQTILKDNTNNKRVIGHRFLVDVSGNLLIDNVRLEDDGKWQCEAEDAFGFVVQGKPIQLTILAQPCKSVNFFSGTIIMQKIECAGIDYKRSSPEPSSFCHTKCLFSSL
ncbi:unnamed protein product [Diabrotica balteata]|uniref:Ig-like domain-containing protein n=1 Tax=Diabrotica balteata TaxID=107213 RepID=A0A9N9X8U2_DIABA|nr:unnamed protein product [Diabrotica balteata]